MAGNYDTHRILAQDHLVSNDTWKTGLNNNDLIIGPSGSGKTRGYVKPNLLQCALEGKCSLIVADAKGNLVKEVGPVLAAHGYNVINLNFIKLLNNTCGYNPLDFIEYDPERKMYSQQDILTIATCLCPTRIKADSFWEDSARTYIIALIAYVMEALPEEEHTLEAVIKLSRYLDQKTKSGDFVGKILFSRLEQENPNSFACQKYLEATEGRDAEKTYSCIKMFVNTHLGPLNFDGAKHMFRLKERIDFQRLGRELTAVFLTISDIDRSMDDLTNLFYTQALNKLLASADRDYPDNRLPVPVRFILDDFATNVFIPRFDRISSNVRSREIYLSVILQSVTQLYSLYEKYAGATIINNCDSCLYLGGQDTTTAGIISQRAGRTIDSILHMPRGEMWLMTGSSKAVRVSKYDLTSHPLYHELPEAGNVNVLESRSNAGKVKIDFEQSACPILDKRIEQVLRDGKPGFQAHGDEKTVYEFRDEEYEEDKEGDFAPPVLDEEDLGAVQGLVIPDNYYPNAADGSPVNDERGVIRLMMSGEQLKSLRSRRKQLADKAARLELVMSGRCEPVLPWVAVSETGCYSEQKLWDLVDELAEDDELTGISESEAALAALARSFFYCALRLASNPPLCLPELTGTFDDVLWAVRDAAEADELRTPGGFISQMDELYEAVAGTSVAVDFRDGYMEEIPDFAPVDLTEEELDAIEEVAAKMHWGEMLEYDGPLDSHGNPLIDEDAARREQARKDWAQSLPAPVIFCQQYLQLRRLLLNAGARKQLARVVENALDRFLYEHQLSHWIDGTEYSDVCDLLDEMMEKVQGQLHKTF